jgi:hypothetical protein
MRNTCIIIFLKDGLSLSLLFYTLASGCKNTEIQLPSHCLKCISKSSQIDLDFSLLDLLKNKIIEH